MEKINFKKWLSLQEVDLPPQVPQQVMVQPAVEPLKGNAITPQELAELDKDILEMNQKILVLLRNFDPFVMKLKRELSSSAIHPQPPFQLHSETDPAAYFKNEDQMFETLDQIKSNLEEVSRKLNRLRKDLLHGAPDDVKADDTNRMINQVQRANHLGMVSDLIDNLAKAQKRTLDAGVSNPDRIHNNNFFVIDTLETIMKLNFKSLLAMVSDLRRFEEEERLQKHLANRAQLLKKGLLKPNDKLPLPPLPPGVDD